MVYRTTNNITFVLIHAALEWTLILLLLLNSLFSFLIIKFSQFFTLTPPCFWCSTLHRFLEPQNTNTHKDLLCQLHSKEVSSLGFCPNHNKLAEIKDLCEDCFSSHLGFQSELNQSDGDEQHEHNIKCSCCGFKLEKKSVHDSLLSRSSFDVLEYVKNGGSDDQIGSDLAMENLEIECRKVNQMDFDVWNSNTFEIGTRLTQCEKRQDSTSEFLPQDLEFFFDFSGSQLVPIELIDSPTEESQNISEADEDHEFRNCQKALVLEEHHKDGLESMEFVNEKSDIVEGTETLFVNTKEVEVNAVETEKFEPDTHLVHVQSEVSIGTEIPFLDCSVAKPWENSHDFHLEIENGSESKNRIENHNEIEEEKIPDAPGSVKLLTIERKESGAEESFDGSVMSEMEGGDPINTVEKLKSALKAERKALHALYTELEEERGASEVATAETMAMINRLQEEKAAMQMEALHYQRMMEEQSEYDQEALQLLNELMIKREKELDSYRKRVADYEAKDRMRFSHDTCSASDDWETNGNQETSHQSVGDDSFVDLESSLTDFDHERLSILEQLKVLEENLFALSDEEDHGFVDVRPIEDFHEENGIEKKPVSGLEESEAASNGFHSCNGKKRMEMEEEVYGRLQALEADREFLKHCIGSLKKGDKGMELLQEILQHLRDLRTMDLQR